MQAVTSLSPVFAEAHESSKEKGPRPIEQTRGVMGGANCFHHLVLGCYMEWLASAALETRCSWLCVKDT